jgi:hypothetical protein
MSWVSRRIALTLTPMLLGAGAVLACSGSEVTQPGRGLRLSVRPDSVPFAGADGEIVVSIDLFRDGRRVTNLRPRAISTNPTVATVTPEPIPLPDAEGAPVVIVRTRELGDALIITTVEDGMTRLADTTIIRVRGRLIGP